MPAKLPLLLLATILAALPAAVPAGAEATPADEVDPFIGTGGHGHTYPGATLPFGMVQLSPDTRLEGWDGCSGYHASDDTIYGFSHTHLSGTGIPDYADVLFMPLTGEPYLENGHAAGAAHGYASRFDRSTERAGVGWYSVRLADHGIDVELTATERSGAQRYRFPQGEAAWVIVDLTHRDEVLESSLRLVGDREIEGKRRSTGWARDQIVYFVARFSRPWERAELALDGAVVTGSTSLEGKDVRGRFAFGDEGQELLVRVGLSAVDIDGARRNLEAEQGERTFDELRSAARERWNEALGRIEIDGGSPAQREIFRTALYHAMLAPNVYSDVDGRYRGMDRQIHRAEGRRHYTVFSLWDTFRSTHPLYTLIETERTREFVETFLAQYEQGGRLPVWELAANETDTMIGYHAVPVIVDAWVKGVEGVEGVEGAKGLRGFDGRRALDAMVASASADRFGLAAYRKQGFIDSEDDGESVSKTLEYAYDDACIAWMAEDLGRADVAREFSTRSQAWRHVLDPASGFMRARRNQRWIEPFDPRRVDNHYTEANAWQYSFFVPQDVPGLIAALGGDARFVERLDALFAAESETTGREQADITGMLGQYAHGNEPSHHVAWLYHHAGRPGASARRVRQIVDELYTAEPDGLSGNEDCGQMSSWYVLAAIGLYAVTPCTDEWLIGVPLFERVTLHLESGKRFVVRTRGAPPGRGAFIASATLDGRPLTRSFLRHAEIARGGELVLTLAATAGKAWGRAPADRPGQGRTPQPAVPAAPFLRAEDDRFRTRMLAELASAEPRATIRYRRTGTDASWTTYAGPIEITDSTRLQFFAAVGARHSPTVEARLHRIPHDWDVQLESTPNAQYTAGGPLALIDGLRGDSNWRTGGWMGFQYTDFAATLDMKGPREVRRAGASFLQDQRSWIWMPAEVVVSVSSDGAHFREIARLRPDVAEHEEGVVLRDVVAQVAKAVEARYVRVTARSLGRIPDWHAGRGDGAFVFVDELIVD